MTATGTVNSYYCTACGSYHAPSIACPAYNPMPYGYPWPQPQQYYVAPNRDAEILAVLERIEALLLQLVSQPGGHGEGEGR